MYTSSLPCIPNAARIQSDAEAIAIDVLLLASSAERQPIVAYGRCLLDNVTPSAGQTMRYWSSLHMLAYRLPDYLHAAAHLSTDLAALRALQDEIARQVAKGVAP